MTNSKLPVWLWAAVALSTLLASFSVYKRWQVEVGNRATSIAVEYETAEGMASAQGVPLEKALADLKAQGVNSLVLGESTVAELIAKGQATIETTTWPSDQKPGSPLVYMSTLKFTDRGQMARTEQGLRIRFNTLANRLQGRTPDTLDLPNVSPLLIRTTPIGLDPRQTDVAAKAGMMIIARCANPPGLNTTGVVQTLEWAHSMGASVFLPEGDQVLGRRDALGATIDTLRRLGMLYATPEFAKIGGDTEVVEKAPDIIVRLHSAQAAELDKLTPADAIERYSKAARERNMRILLIRPLTFASDTPSSSLAEFIKKIDDQILAQGGAMGRPKAYQEPNLPRFFPILLGLAIAPVVWFSVGFFVTKRTVKLVGAALVTLLALACFQRTGMHAMAFLASIAFPFVGFIVADSLPTPSLPRWAQPLPVFLLICLFSLVGGLCVAGMLNGLPFYIKADEFKGTKISVFLPILGVGIFYLTRLGDIRKTLKSPINWSSVVLGVVILAVLGLMIARTGNDTGVGASDGEIVFRGFLDRILYVRPRTKEFLIGHPLLIIGIGLLLTLRKPFSMEDERTKSLVRDLTGWVALAMMVGSMGQTDIVNTLCHLHIPVVLSLARVGLGVLLGCIIGLALWSAVLRLLPKAEA